MSKTPKTITKKATVKKRAPKKHTQVPPTLLSPGDTLVVTTNGEPEGDLVPQGVNAYTNLQTLVRTPNYKRMPYIQRVGCRLRDEWNKFKHSLPQLVFYGQEVDVLIAFRNEDPSMPTPIKPIVNPQFGANPIGEATLCLRAADIKFDVGVNDHGRCWYFDYSLTGPIRVKFIGKAKNSLLARC